jgi:hypothetical protein
MGNTLNRPNNLFKSPNKESFLTHKRNKSLKISSSQFWEKIKSNIVLKPKKPKDNTIENKDNKLLNISNECNQDEILLKSSDTCPNSSKNNICEISDEEEEIEETDEEEEENEENGNNKFLIITNNIKKIFIDSISKEKKEELIEINNNKEKNLSEETFDYELNIFRDSDALRKNYISKLITKNVWNPSMKPKIFNSLIIFDWDDTLIPTSFLTPDGVFPDKILLSQTEFDKIKEIEKNVNIILKQSIEKGKAYIITNACANWVQFSASIFYPSISDLLKKIKIISARGEYEKAFPDNLRQWKIQAFSDLIKDFDEKLVTNIICIGDSLFEIEAGRILASKFKEAFIKTIKFREAPKLDELLKQLKLVAKQFGSIYSSIKNMTIRIEKKKKEEF